MMRFFHISRRSGFGTCLLMLLLLAICSPASADESWVGKKILTKKADIRIGYTDENDQQRIVATLKGIDYVVVAEQGDFIKVRENGVEGWFDKADAVLLEDAIPYFTARIRRNERDDQAYAHRGTVWQIKEEYDIAIKDYNEAIRLQPDEAAWFNNRGLIWRDKKDYDRAIKDYNEAIRLDPKYALAFRNRGVAWWYKESYDRALEDYDEAIRLHPNYVGAFNDRGNAYLSKKDYDRAIRDYGEAIRLDPKYALAFRNRGLTYGRKKDYDRAIEDFSEAIRLDPKYAKAFNSRGYAYGKKKEYDRAIRDYDAAIRLDAKNTLAFYNRGNAHDYKKDYERAIQDYSEAIRLAPKYAEAFNQRAWLWATCADSEYRDGKRAVESAKRACELTDWKNANCIDTLAAAYAEKGQFDKAIAEQLKALEDKSLDAKTRAKMEQRLRLYREKKPYRDEE